MDKALKNKWIKALRSGKYRQGTGRLKLMYRYCCLGVLADIQGATWCNDYTSLANVPCLLNGKVIERIGDEYGQYLKPKFAGGLSKRQQTKLSDMNDGDEGRSYSFKEIADYIEKRYK